MAKDFGTISDINPTAGTNTGADFGGELENNNGVDLNDGTKGGFSKATMMSYEASPPEDYSTDAIRSPDYAEFTEAPFDANQSTLEQLQESYPGYEITMPGEEPRPSPLDEAQNLNDIIEEGDPAPESEPPMVLEPVAEQHPPDPPPTDVTSEESSDT